MFFRIRYCASYLCLGSAARRLPMLLLPARPPVQKLSFGRSDLRRSGQLIFTNQQVMSPVLIHLAYLFRLVHSHQVANLPHVKTSEY